MADARSLPSDTAFEQFDLSSRALLYLLSWFAADPIPVAVWQTPAGHAAILSVATVLAKEGALTDAGAALAELSRRGLIHWEAERSAFRVDTSVQEVTRARLDPAVAARSLRDALSVIHDYLRQGPPPHDVRSWPRWTLVGAHAARLVAHAEPRPEQHGESTSTTRLMGALAQWYGAKNRPAEAEPLMRRALAISEQSHGAEHPLVAVHLNNLAQLLVDTNRLTEAEPLMLRALAIDERYHGAQHPEVATGLSNLAHLLQATNRLAQAEPLLRRALAIDEVVHGAEHPEVAADLENLAQLLVGLNRRAEAEPLLRLAVAILRTSLGNEHPDTLAVAEKHRRLGLALPQ